MDSMDNFRERFEALEQRTEQLKHQTCTGERRRWRLTWSVAAMVILGLALASPYEVRAKTFHCSAGDVQCLIAAINMANANGTKNTIRLEAGTYTLTAIHNDTDGPNGLPSMTSPRPMTIQGAGAESTIIERDPSAPRFRLFHVAATGVLTLHGLTVRGGEVQDTEVPCCDTPLGGGGIWNRGTLLLQHTLLASNVARGTALVGQSPAGGGLYNVDGRVTLIDSTVAGNLATSDFGADGGGLWNGGTMTLTRSTLRDNGAQGARGSVGGGLWNGGTVTLTNCVLTGNTTGGRFSRGGGIANAGTLTVTHTILTNNTASGGSGGSLGGGIWSDGMLIITQSTFTSNHAQNGQGGGLLSSGTVSITISTFADNSALGGGASEGGGGGGLSISGTGSLTNTTVVHNAARDIGGAGTARGGGLEVSGVVTLTNCTIAENVADAFAPPGEGRSDGGGISGSTVDLQNTILARNRSQIRTPDEPDAVSPSECDGPLTSLGTNLIGDPTGCLITLQASDLTGDPGFGDFTDNGTPGNGHFPLLPTSQAIDAGNDAACPPTDQLGQPRVGQCDIGASEFKGGALMNVNDLVTFTPLPSTFTTTLDPACPTGFAGKFSFVARLTAKASSPALTDLRVQVQTLTNGNLLQNADGGPGGVGATLTVPQADAFADGLLSPEEAVDVPFVVCLQERSPFRFLVDVLGIVSDEGE